MNRREANSLGRQSCVVNHSLAMLDSRFGLFACEPPVSDNGHTNDALRAYPTHFKGAYVAFGVQP